MNNVEVVFVVSRIAILGAGLAIGSVILLLWWGEVSILSLLAAFLFLFCVVFDVSDYHTGPVFFGIGLLGFALAYNDLLAKVTNMKSTSDPFIVYKYHSPKSCPRKHLLSAERLAEFNVHNEKFTLVCGMELNRAVANLLADGLTAVMLDPVSSLAVSIKLNLERDSEITCADYDEYIFLTYCKI